MTGVRTSVEGRVGTIILDRPEKLNALSPEMITGFRTGMREFNEDPEISVIVVRGEGRAFSVGYDVSDYGDYTAELSAYDDWAGLRETIDVWLEVWRGPKPVIAQIHGYCMGGATMLAVCCDLTLVADDAVIGWPVIPLGAGLLSPISAWLIGPKRAKQLAYVVGSRMSGKEAADWGWANSAHPAAELDAVVAGMAADIARTPLELLTLKKRAINRVMDSQGFSESVMMGAEYDAISHTAHSVGKILEDLRTKGFAATRADFRGTQA